MAPDISAAQAPAGDVLTAIMDIDSLLRRIHAAGGTGSTGLAAEQSAMMTAAAMEASPTLWRTQFGDWRMEEPPRLSRPPQSSSLRESAGHTRTAQVRYP